MSKNLNELLNSANKEYAELGETLQSVLRGEITANHANKQIKKNLDAVDSLIENYSNETA